MQRCTATLIRRSHVCLPFRLVKRLTFRAKTENFFLLQGILPEVASLCTWMIHTHDSVRQVCFTFTITFWRSNLWPDDACVKFLILIALLVLTRQGWGARSCKHTWRSPLSSALNGEQSSSSLTSSLKVLRRVLIKFPSTIRLVVMFSRVSGREEKVRKFMAFTAKYRTAIKVRLFV